MRTKYLIIGFFAFWLGVTSIAQTVNISPPSAGQLPGTLTNDNANAGNVGEYKTSLASGGTTSGTAIISVGAPGIVTWAAHGLNAGSPVNFTTSGTLPTGATATTNFWVCSASLTANSFAFSTSLANALAGTCVTTTGTTSGTQSVFSNVILTSNTPQTLTGLSLTAGDWDLSGTVFYIPSATITVGVSAVSLVDSALPVGWPEQGGAEWIGSVVAAGPVVNSGIVRVSIAATTNVFLIADGVVGSGTDTAQGSLRARRVR